MPTMSTEQPVFPAISSPSASAKDPTPTRLHTVRILLSNGRAHPIEDIEKNGLHDVVLAAVPLPRLRSESQAQDDHGNTNEAIQVDIAVCEAGMSRVREIYGTTSFVPLSSDDPVVSQQKAKDPTLKRLLCYQELHAAYLREYARLDHARALGPVFEWFENCLDHMCDLLEPIWSQRDYLSG